MPRVDRISQGLTMRSVERGKLPKPKYGPVLELVGRLRAGRLSCKNCMERYLAAMFVCNGVGEVVNPFLILRRHRCGTDFSGRGGSIGENGP